MNCSDKFDVMGSGRSRNHIDAANVNAWQQHSFPSATHLVAQYDRQGENLQRGHMFQRNERNPNGWDGVARFDMEGPPHGNVPTPHVQKGKRAEPLNINDPFGHLCEYGRKKQ